MKTFWAKLIQHIDTPLWLEIFFAVILLLRVPSFFEPYYYGDEMIYLTLGEGIRQGIPLYSGLHDNKPPLLYLIAAISGNLFIFKALLAIFNLLAIYLFWKLTKKLFIENKKLQFLATILFGILTTIPTLEGNIANAENFMIVPTFLGLNLLFLKPEKLKNIFWAGVFFSIASLFKIVAAFDILAIFVFWLVCTNKNNFSKFIKKMFFISLGFIIPLGLTFIWFFLNKSLNDYWTAVFIQNVGYVSSWRPMDATKPFLEKNLPLLIRAGIMFLSFFILWMFQKKLSKSFIFTTAWLSASLFAVTLSERPYPHYLLQSIPPAAILFSMLFTKKNIEQVLIVIPLTLFVFVPFYFKFWYYPASDYYSNFLKFALSKIDKDRYFLHFSPHVVRNYKIAEFLRTSSQKNDGLFVWSNDSSTIYSLSRRLPQLRFVADYHFIDFSSRDETIKMLKEKVPKFVVITDNSYPFPQLYDFLETDYYVISQIDDSQIWLNIKK